MPSTSGGVKSGYRLMYGTRRASAALQARHDLAEVGELLGARLVDEKVAVESGMAAVVGDGIDQPRLPLRIEVVVLAEAVVGDPQRSPWRAAISSAWWFSAGLIAPSHGAPTTLNPAAAISAARASVNSASGGPHQNVMMNSRPDPAVAGQLALARWVMSARSALRGTRVSATAPLGRRRTGGREGQQRGRERQRGWTGAGAALGARSDGDQSPEHEQRRDALRGGHDVVVETGGGVRELGVPVRERRPGVDARRGEPQRQCQCGDRTAQTARRRCAAPGAAARWRRRREPRPRRRRSR